MAAMRLSPGPISYLSSQTSTPRARSASASASTAGLSFDEWLMNTFMGQCFADSRSAERENGRN
jgi:hypothetical protein